MWRRWPTTTRDVIASISQAPVREVNLESVPMLAVAQAFEAVSQSVVPALFRALLHRGQVCEHASACGVFLHSGGGASGGDDGDDDGVTPLRVSEAELVMKHWPYSRQGTLQMLQEALARHDTACVRSSDDDTGEPLAWALTRDDGS